MKHHLPPLDSLKVFEAAARLLSFSDAANELCLSKGAVSYQIKQLETFLGWPLFRRATRQIYLTDQGQDLYQSVQQVFTELDQCIGGIGRRRRQDIRIGATTYVAARWLSRRIARYLEHHPGVTVRFDHAVDQPDFHDHDASLVMRWDRMTNKQVPGRPLELPMPLFPVCSPALAARLAANPEQLQSVSLLVERRKQDLWAEWFGRKTLPNPRQEIADANVRAQATIAGQGLMLADAMMQSELDNGELVAPWPETLDGYGYALDVPHPAALSEAAAALVEWLQRPGQE